MFRRLLLCLLLIGLTAGVSFAKDGSDTRRLTSEESNALARMPLAGLKSVALSVSVDDKLKNLGLAEELVRGACSLHLRMAGVEVTDTANAENTALLVVELKSVKVDDMPIFAVSVNVDLYDKVTLPRAPMFKLPVIVWHESAVSYSGAEKVSKLTLLVNPLVDLFAKDFMIANPKEPEKNN